MGQQGCWHKGMSGQGCHVMPGPIGRRAERRHRATRGARTARHRAPPAGNTPGLRSTGHHPLATTPLPPGDHKGLCHTGPHTLATTPALPHQAPGPTRWRPPQPLHPHWRHPSPYSTRYQPQTTLPVLSRPTSCHLKTEQHPPLIFFGTPNPIAPHNLLCPQRFQQAHVGTIIAKYYAEIVSDLQHSS